MKKLENLHRLLLKYRLVLASGSPRRVRLLNEAAIEFRQIIPDIDEDDHEIIDPMELATTLAEKKALAAMDRIKDDEIALGCDTIVILKGKILGKPDSPGEAFEMLSALSGNCHTVCSAIALANNKGVIKSGYELTDVYFNNVSKQAIEAYIATGEPLDKAGAYGIQEEGGFLVDRIAGNLDNVIGLPMSLLEDLAVKMLMD
jgi:septum formation protein